MIATAVVTLIAPPPGQTTPPVEASGAGASAGPDRRLAAAFDVGARHACAIVGAGDVVCWGSDDRGQLGNGDAAGAVRRPDTTPVSLPGAAEAIATGSAHSCALLTDGRVICWGRNGSGQLGIGGTSTADVHSPEAVSQLPAPGRAIAVSAGIAHTCALLAGGVVTCWGSDVNGQLGNGATSPKNVRAPTGAVELPAKATAIAVGNRHSCALLSTGAVSCWGFDASGQLGNGGANQNEVSPSEVVNLPHRVAAIAAGGAHTCAIFVTGSLFCWGEDGSGQLGNDPGNTDDVDAYTDTRDLAVLPPNRSARAVSAGGQHTCAVLDNRTAACWGDNERSQLGLVTVGGSQPTPGRPVEMRGQATVAVNAGGESACGMASATTLICWGDNSAGQSGSGLSGPVQVLPRFVVIADDESARSLRVSVAPLPPTGVVASPRVRAATVSWTAPTDSGSTPIGQYRIEASIDDGPWATVESSAQSRSATSATVSLLESGASYRFRVVAVNAQRPSAPSAPSASITPRAGPGPNGADAPGIVPVTPGRLLETRSGEPTVDGQAEGIGRRAAGQITTVEVWGRGGVPAGATAGVFNVAAVDPAQQGFVAAFPCSARRPEASMLNHQAGQRIANGALIQLSPQGTVCIYTHRATDLILDATAYSPPGSIVNSITPARLVESRQRLPTIDGQQQGIGRREAGAVTTVQVTGRSGIPDDAAAGIFNIAAVDPAAQGFIAAYPCDAQRPDASTLNHRPVQTIANGAIVKLSPLGTICVYTHRDTDLIVDVTGWFRESPAITTITPARLVDSRQGLPTIDGQQQGIGRRAAGAVTTVQVTGRDGIPDDAAAGMFNIAAVDPAAQGFIAAYPCDVQRPGSSSLNHRAGQTIANNATIRLSPRGTICVYTHRATDLIVDITGFTK